MEYHPPFVSDEIEEPMPTSFSEMALDTRKTGKPFIYREIKVKGRKSYEQDCYEDKGGQPWRHKDTRFKDLDYPMVSRRVFNLGGTHLKTVIRFNSQILMEALKETLPPKRCVGYGELFSLKTKIHKPYILFYQNRQVLQNGVERYSHGGFLDKAVLLQMLLDFLKADMPSTWEKIDQLAAKELFVERSGIWEAFKVEHVTAVQFPAVGPLEIHAYHLDLDSKGVSLIPAKRILTQPPFAGERLISNLKVIPEAYLQGHSEISQQLIQRGESFWNFGREPAYRQYEGDAWPKTSSGSTIKVVIDYVTSSAYDERAEHRYSNDESCDCSICVKNYADLASYGQAIQTASNICVNDRTAVRYNIPGQHCQDGISMDHIAIFCPSKVWAFSLKHKSWNQVEVCEISDVPWETKPFDKLILDQTHKSIVESMVETRLSNTLTDLIKEKGRGLVILIHGAPGTGKTLTAECVAEKQHKPLYMVTCGDLGTDPDVLEERLEEIFLLAVNWKAVLLLDEADVFLQERDLHDLNRNALVSVFLRHIEYYDGVIFLTTNRPGQIDEAFQSRIHVTLGLPELNWTSQKLIWNIFINRLKFKGTTYSKEARLKLLAFVQDDLEAILQQNNYQMNGRQIRNCLRTASAIANKDDRAVEKGDIIAVIDLGGEFKDYIKRLHRMNEDERIAALGARALSS
ncbi:hypothetical protein H9Q70_004156 [Fusarium xylarioides]|nr:hypothetical protein H9Q70_004156 [Fusarium xylarioides]